MHHEFWHEKWHNNSIAFHAYTPNYWLVRHITALAPKNNERIFIPLCGKTLDIGWLVAHNYSVVGVELSDVAINQLCDELGLTPTITHHANMVHYAMPNIDIFIGDIFDISTDILGRVDAVFDRGALVALPEEMRGQYVHHIQHITNGAPTLLVTVNYDQALMKGPPFAVNDAMVEGFFNKHYTIEKLGERHDADLSTRPNIDGFSVHEQAWLLQQI